MEGKALRVLDREDLRRGMTLAVIDGDFDGCSWTAATIAFPKAASARSTRLLVDSATVPTGGMHVATEWWDR
jgi:hypothetical protein